MSRRRDDHVRSEHRVIPDVDVRVVHKRQIEVCVDVFPEVAVRASPICVKRRLYAASFADVPEHLFKHFRAFFRFGRTRHVVVVKPVETLELCCCDLFVAGEIKLTRVHFFFHAHFLYRSRRRDIPFVFRRCAIALFTFIIFPERRKIKSFKACCIVFYALCAVGTLYRTFLFQVFSKCLKPQYHVSLEKVHTKSCDFFTRLFFKKLL